jgi:hypothetical protein
MKKIYIYTLTTLLLWGVTSCKKPNDFGNANVNPATTTIPIPSALLTNVEAGLGGMVSNNSEPVSGGMYAQYFAETQYPGTSLYAAPTGAFTGYYSGPLYDLQTIINLNQDKNMVTLAKILQQYIYWMITDTWGDVPYSQALLGLGAITPAYDKQEDIYKGILANLTSASAALTSGPIAGDVIYGDAAAWKKAANSLRMLVAIQMSKKLPGATDYAATEFKAALAASGGYIADNSSNMQFLYNAVYKNPWYNAYNGRTDYAESKTITDITAGMSDGRSVPFGGAFNDPKQVTGGTVTSADGVPYGLDRPGVTAFTALHADWPLILRADYRTPSSPLVIISAAEVTLARAEAANLGWTTEGIKATYQLGIQQSFAQWGISAPPASYYTQAAVAVTDVPQPLLASINTRNISIQRYLASYPDGHQAWNIWRKTSSTAIANPNPKGWPALTPAPGATNISGQIVRRFPYPTTEYTTNTVSVKAAATRYTGGDSQDAHMWWDTTP